MSGSRRNLAALRQDSWKSTSPSVLCGQLEIAGKKPSSAQARSLMSFMVLLDGWRLPFSVLGRLSSHPPMRLRYLEANLHYDPIIDGHYVG